MTLKTIMDVCAISERSAYRYLNYISEANVPVHFDKDLHAYRLNDDLTRLPEPTTIDETVLMLVGLHLLSRQLNKYYKAETNDLIKKIISCQSVPLEEILLSLNDKLEVATDTDDYSSLVSSILISAAVKSKAKVRLLTGDADSQQREVQVENPSLWFKKKWRVAGTGLSDDKSVDISKIKRVSVVR